MRILIVSSMCLAMGCSSASPEAPVAPTPAASPVSSPAEAPAMVSASVPSASASATIPEPPRTAASEACAKDALNGLKRGDFAQLSKLAHPERGIRFTPYAFVGPENVVLKAAELKGAAKDKTMRTWGSIGETGDPIRMTVTQYRARYAYDRDYAKSNPAPPDTTDPFESRFWNMEALRGSLRETYPNGVVFEFRNPPKNADHATDYRVLRIVCEEHAGRQYVTGVIHSEGTP